MKTLKIIEEDAPFEWYIETGYTNPPDFSQYGFLDFNLIYEHQIYPHGVDRDSPVTDDMLNFEVGNGPIVLDVEHWIINYSNKTHVEKNQVIHRYYDLIKRTKQIHNKPVGVYAIIPAYMHPDSINSESRYIDFLQNCERRQILASIADTIHPVLYPRHTDADEWRHWAMAILAKTRSMTNKKIIPFISSEYNGLTVKYFDVICETVKEMADGAIAWHGGGGNKGEWDSPNWFETLKTFI